MGCFFIYQFISLFVKMTKTDPAYQQNVTSLFAKTKGSLVL